jgi:hypothetical protein
MLEMTTNVKVVYCYPVCTAKVEVVQNERLGFQHQTLFILYQQSLLCLFKRLFDVVLLFQRCSFWIGSFCIFKIVVVES